MVGASLDLFTKARLVISAGTDVFALVLSKSAWAVGAAHCGTDGSV